MSEFIISLPLLDQASIAIENQGFFSAQMNAQQLKDIMKEIVNGLLSGQDMVKIAEQQINVAIEQQEGKVIGNVIIDKPIKATIEIECILANNEGDDSKIILKDLKISQKAGMLARAALNAVNIEGKARQALGDPNQALLQTLQEQLANKNINISGISLQFTEDLLNLNLTGEKE